MKLKSLLIGLLRTIAGNKRGVLIITAKKGRFFVYLLTFLHKYAIMYYSIFDKVYE